jgi:2-polyprenyl-3-methyl-5-hydroxy-6-metoxy-1,4-benzoquinol methylase
MITSCPICNKPLTNKMRAEDYVVSNEVFDLLSCTFCDLLCTDINPNQDFSRYYESPEYHSHVQTGTGLISSLYNLVKRHTLKTKRRLINRQLVKPGSILDIGCGTGDFLLTMQKAGWHVTGSEPSDKARIQAETKLGQPIHSDIKLIDAKFDVITLWHVLEHIPDLQNTFNRITELLTQNGTLIIAVPNHKSFDARYYKEHWAGLDVPRHLWHFSPKSLSQLTNRKHLKTVKTLPMYFDSFYVSLLSEKYRRGSITFLGYIRAIAVGAYSNMAAMLTGKYSSLIYIIRK